MKKHCLIIFFLIFITLGYAQENRSQFVPLKSEGPIPQDFLKYQTNSKFNESALSDLFKSGLILYGTNLNQYLDHVMDQLLQDYPDVRKEVRIYIFKSVVVNAMAFEDHIILVNLGLLAQVQNESELAFILAHELVHIVNKHIEKEHSGKSKKKDKNTEISTKTGVESFMSHHYRSREHEFEADREGFEKFYKNSGYSISALDGVFDLLQYSFLPFDEVPFNKSYFETDFYQFPENYSLVNLNPIRSREDNIDTLSTHPNVLKRRVIIQTLANKMNANEGQLFLQPEELFLKIRRQARFECIQTYLTFHEYGDCFYNTYVLLKEDPQDQFLNRALVASLYGLYEHKENGDFESVLVDYNDSEGQIQQSNYFFKKLKKDELLLLVLKYAWINAQKFPDELYFNDIATNIFKITSQKKLKIVPDQDVKIKGKKGSNQESTITQDTLNKDQSLLYNIFQDLRKDSTFIQWVEKQRKGILIHSDISDEQMKLQDFQNCSKIVVFAPNYYVIKSNNSYKNKPESIYNLISKIKIPNTTVELLYYNENIASSTDLYNQYCDLKLLYYDLKNANQNEMQLYHNTKMESIKQLTGTTYFAFVDAVTSPPIPDYRKIPLGVLSPVLPVMIPFTLFYVFTPRKYAAVELEIVNINTANCQFYNQFLYGLNTTPFIHNYIYSKIMNFKKGK